MRVLHYRYHFIIGLIFCRYQLVKVTYQVCCYARKGEMANMLYEK